MERSIEPQDLALASLRRAIDETIALGYVEVARDLEAVAMRFGGVPGARYTVQLCATTLLIGDQPAKLTGRELELCCALATFRNGASTEVLAALIYPDLEREIAVNRLKVTVHRVRDRVGADFILSQSDGYRFGLGVEIDLQKFEDIIRAAGRRTTLSQEQRDSLATIILSVRGRRNAPVWRWEWWQPTEGLMEVMALSCARMLADDALRRGEPGDAIDLAQQITALDPCNEQAHEIAITAHLAAGQRSEALAAFRHFEAVLARDLQVAPPAYLQKLVLAI